MRVSYEQLKNEIKRVFLSVGMDEADADICAAVHADSTNDGIYSHGVNRVARFVQYAKKGWVDVKAKPTLYKAVGSIRVYDGNLGPGVLNALFACDEAMKLADEYGIGMVSLRNTTHWMRGGTYGLRAAEKGYAAIMWTNTEACMPVWGSKNARTGNNPLVMAAPRAGKAPLLLDMAISQYSYGKLQVTRLAGKQLPYPGGFDRDGKLTADPAALEESRRMLPIGYWKGSGLAVMLDVLGGILADGNTAVNLSEEQKGSCGECSQVMIVINPEKIASRESIVRTVEEAIAYVKAGEPDEHTREIRVPGEGAEAFHREHAEKGIYVDDKVWQELTAL